MRIRGWLLPGLGLALLAACGDEGEVERRPPALELRVLDEGGRAVAGAEVSLHVMCAYCLEAKRRDAARSGEDGRVILDPGPPPGPEEWFVVAARAPGRGAVTLPLAEARRGIRLAPGHPVEGLVTDLRGRPLAGAWVSSPPFPPYAVSTRTDERGRFRLESLADDAWIRARAPGYAPLDISLSLYPVENRDLVFYLTPGRRVAGRVTDSAGRGVGGAMVELDQEVRSRYRADADGRFSIDRTLPDWEVVLTARAPGLISEPVTALCGGTGVVLPLYRPAAVEGRVRDGETGRPVRDFEIWKPAGKRLPGGRFRVEGLLPGRSRIEIRAGPLAGETEVDLREGETRRGVVVALFPAGWAGPEERAGEIPVRVRTLAAAGGPAAGAGIRLAGTERRTRSSAAGEAVLRLPPGPRELLFGGDFEAYAPARVRIDPRSQGEITVRLRRNPDLILEFRGTPAPPGTKVWLHRGGKVAERMIEGEEARLPASRTDLLDVLVEAKGYLPELLREVRIPDDGRIPVLLRRGPVIRGRCLGEGGHPLARVVAEIEELSSKARQETAGDGLFRVGPLRPGRYRLLVYARNVRSRRFEIEVGEKDVDLGDIALQAPSDLRILVVNRTDRPVAGAHVETSYLVAAKGLTDAAGRITLPGTEASDLLRVRADGYLDAWQEISVSPDRYREDVVVRLTRAARLLVRVVDGEGRPAPVLLPDREDLAAHRVGPGQLVLDGLPPGLLEIELSDREGRRGTLRTWIREGDDRVERVVLE